MEASSLKRSKKHSRRRREGAENPRPDGMPLKSTTKRKWPTLDLPSSMPERNRQELQEMYERGDVPDLLYHAYYANNMYMLDIVRFNVVPLKRRGIYEEALLKALTGRRTNHRFMLPSQLKRLFEMANRTKLRGLGEPLDFDGWPLTVCRGVSGAKAHHRRVKSVSWTLSLDVACFFATRFYQPRPTIYTATVSEPDVYVYYNGRDEQEIIAAPTDIKPLSLDPDELHRRSAAFSAGIQARNKAL